MYCLGSKKPRFLVMLGIKPFWFLEHV